MTAASERWDSLCHYNTTAASPEVDPNKDCGLPAAWHFLAPQGESGEPECYQACDGHQRNALLLDGIEQFHEFGSGCGLEGSYWLHEQGTCATEETLIVNGLAWHEVPDVYSKPLHPLPGTHVWIQDIDQWVKFVDGMWVEAEPLNRASR